MAHFPKPFIRTARNSWFVQIGPRQIKLGADKDAAITRYYELMAAPDAKPVTAAEAARLVAVFSRLRRETSQSAYLPVVQRPAPAFPQHDLSRSHALPTQAIPRPEVDRWLSRSLQRLETELLPIDSARHELGRRVGLCAGALYSPISDDGA